MNIYFPLLLESLCFLLLSHFSVSGNFFLFFFTAALIQLCFLYLVLVAKRTPLRSTVNYCFFFSLFFFLFDSASDSIFSLTSLIHSQTRAFKSTGITITLFSLLRYFVACLFFLTPYFPFIFTRVPPGPTWPSSAPFCAAVKRPSRRLTTPLVHDLAISAALLSLLPCPFAILRLIDIADLSPVRRKHRSLLQLLVDKERAVELL